MPKHTIYLPMDSDFTLTFPYYNTLHPSRIKLTHVVNPNLRNSSVAQAELELTQSSCFNLNSWSYRCVMPSQNLGECFRNPKTSKSSVYGYTLTSGNDSKPSTGRYRAGWLWGSWVQSQAELHIQTPLSSLEPGMVTHNCNIGTGEAERKRRIAKSLCPVCHTQGTLGQPSYRVSACPTPNPSKFINTNLQAYTNSPPPTNSNFCLLYCCKGNPGPCTALHWTPPPVFPWPHWPKDMKTTHYTFLFICEGKVHWPDPPTGRSIQPDKRSGLKSQWPS